MAENNGSQMELFGEGQTAKRCVKCNKPVDRDGTRCRVCCDKWTAYMKSWRAGRGGKGSSRLCYHCNAKAVPGRSECEKCRGRFKLGREQAKLRCFDAYGGRKCNCCGEGSVEFLCLDHIHNNGAVERSQFEHPASGTGTALYRRLARCGFPAGYQVLCHNCNAAKHILGECPHETRRRGGNLMPYKDPAARRRYLRDRRQRLLDSGMCGSCGVEARHKGGSFCMTCKEKSRAETVALRAEAVKAYGGKCACCGEAEAVFLNVDHVDPARYYSRRKRGERVPSGNNLLRELRARKWPAGFQILCWNCNYGKSVYGTCPHKHQDRQSHSGGPGEET